MENAAILEVAGNNPRCPKNLHEVCDALPFRLFASDDIMRQEMAAVKVSHTNVLNKDINKSLR